MTILLLFSALALSPPTEGPAANGHCDSKPFTLKKPVQTASAAPVAPKPAPKPKPAAKSKPKVAIGCKQPDSKSG